MNAFSLLDFLKRRIHLVLILAVILSLLPAGLHTASAECTDPLGCVEVPNSGDIHIAYLLATTGGASNLGIDEKNGIQMAVSDALPIHGHGITFDGYDSDCTFAGGETGAQVLDDDPSIVGVIGTTCSGEAFGALPFLSAAGFTVVSPSATNPSLTDGTHPGFFRTAWNDTVQGEAAAQFAVEFLGASEAATITLDGNPYSSSLVAAFATELVLRGGTITTQQTVLPGGSNVSAVLTSIAASEPDLIYFPVFPSEGTSIIVQARAMPGLEEVFLMGSDGLYDNQVVIDSGSAIEGFMATNFDYGGMSTDYVDVFLPAYVALYGEPPAPFHAHAYDAFMLLWQAIGNAAIDNGDGTLTIPRTAIREQMDAITGYAGLTGSLTCASNGECGSSYMGAYEFHTGQFPPEYVWPNFVPVSLAAADCSYGGLISSVEATAPDTVVFNLCRADPAFLPKLAMTSFAIYPEKWLEATSGESTRTEDGLSMPVGTGPYQVGSWVPGTSLTFNANPDYWGTAPIASALQFRWSTNPASRLLALQNSQIDGYEGVALEDYATIDGDATLQRVARPVLNTLYMGMTNTFTPFDNQNVRKAIAMAINQQQIVDNFFPQGSQVATHFTPCSIPNGCVGDPWYAYNLAQAQTLLTNAGYPSGFSTTLYYRDVSRAYLPDPAGIANQIATQLAALNITVTVQAMDSSEFLNQVWAGQINGLYLLGWGADVPHVTDFLDYHFGQQNLQFGTPHPAIYGNLQLGATKADPAEAEPFYIAANTAIRDLVPMVPIAHAANSVAYRADVTNPQASPLAADHFAESDPGGRSPFIWMQNIEPPSLFCADEANDESLRACEQYAQGLFAFTNNGSAVEPALATGCVPNADLTSYSCTLRPNVKFHDGSLFDARDVVATFTMGLDASSPTHTGRSNAFDYYKAIFGLMNVPCYTLTRTHTGSGSNPTANPTNSPGCAAGEYHANEYIELSAAPAAGWGIGTWAGTDDDSSTATINSVTMPDADHTATVNYISYIVTGTYRSTGTYDGWVLESSENSSLGGTRDAAATTFNLGDEAGDKQYRSILSFNTASLPDDAVITKITLQIKKQSLVGSNPFASFNGLKIDIRKPFFGTSSSLLIGDFQAGASRTGVGTFGAAPAAGGWYSAVLSSSAFNFINRLGMTQFKLYFARDDNDDMGADYMKFFSGNYLTASYRPTLIIKYYDP